MNRAVNIGQQPGAKESISYLSSLENDIPPPPPPPKMEVSHTDFYFVYFY